jgi:hypothetical protein
MTYPHASQHAACSLSQYKVEIHLKRVSAELGGSSRAELTAVTSRNT